MNIKNLWHKICVCAVCALSGSNVLAVLCIISYIVQKMYERVKNTVLYGIWMMVYWNCGFYWFLFYIRLNLFLVPNCVHIYLSHIYVFCYQLAVLFCKWVLVRIFIRYSLIK